MLLITPRSSGQVGCSAIGYIHNIAMRVKNKGPRRGRKKVAYVVKLPSLTPSGAQEKQKKNNCWKSVQKKNLS